MIHGFLGTRADLIMDLTLVGVVSSPILMAYSFRSARRLNTEKHRKIQIVLFFVLSVVVVLFEIDVRISSFTKAFFEPTAWVGNRYFNYFLSVHISVAVATFLAWLMLGVLSQKSFKRNLPGSFSMNHKRFGMWIFSGLIYTAVSGSVIYLLAFAL